MNTHVPPLEIPEEGEKFVSGTPRKPEDKTPIPDGDFLISALETVHDPEIPVNIYALGLIYDLSISPEGNVHVTMTLTSPACPVAGILPRQVAETLATVRGVGEVRVKVTWDPPWNLDMLSDEARIALGYL